MASDTCTKTTEMNGSDNKTVEISNSDIKVRENQKQNAFLDAYVSASNHSSDDEDKWSVLSPTSSDKLFVTENQGLLTDTDTESEDESSRSSDDDSICASDNESTCTEEQELDNAHRCQQLELKLEDFQGRIEKCRCEKAELFQDKQTLVGEKLVYLEEIKILIKEQKVLLTEKETLLVAAEALSKERSRDNERFRVEMMHLKGNYSANLDVMQHIINKKDTLLDEKQKLLEAAEALAKEKSKVAMDSALDIVCLVDEHNAELITMQKTIRDKDFILFGQQTMLKTAEALAQKKGQDAENSGIEIQRLRDQEHATFALMEETIKTSKNEHAQELRAVQTEVMTFKKELEEVKRHRDGLERDFQDTVVLHNEHLDEIRADLSETKLSRDDCLEQLKEAASDKERYLEIMDSHNRQDDDLHNLGAAYLLLEQELKEVNWELEDVKGDRNTLRGDLNDLTKRREVLEERLEEVNGDRNSLQGELNDLLIKHDIVVEKLEEVMAAGNSFEDKVNECIKEERVELTEANKKLKVFYHIFPGVEKYSGDEFQQSTMNLEDKYTRTIDTEKLGVYLSSMMAEAEVEL